jgi:hypothetical protein
VTRSSHSKRDRWVWASIASPAGFLAQSSSSVERASTDTAVVEAACAVGAGAVGGETGAGPGEEPQPAAMGNAIAPLYSLLPHDILTIETIAHALISSWMKSYNYVASLGSVHAGVDQRGPSQIRTQSALPSI